MTILDDLIAVHVGVATWLVLWMIGKAVARRLLADAPVLRLLWRARTAQK